MQRLIYLLAIVAIMVGLVSSGVEAAGRQQKGKTTVATGSGPYGDGTCPKPQDGSGFGKGTKKR